VSAGGENTCAVLSTHHVECWGDNGFGQLGNGRAQSTDPGSAVPTPVKGIANATAISAGGYDTCARLSTGHVDCWGSNGSGALGAGLPPSLITHAATPVAVSKITNATGVAAANWEACAVLSTGAIKCWGWNIAGELGNGTQKDSPAPVPVTGITNATGVAAAVLQTCAALQTGAVMCWGDEQGGVLGPDAPNGPCQSAYGYCTTTPIPVPPIVNATSVTATIIHTCAALQTGGIDCWGENLGGDLGDGTTAGTSTPTAVVGLPF
jgi:alpha-tubulin suppressor-like RCC1 family protein